MIATSQFTISVIKDGKDGAPGATGPQGVSVTNVVPEYRLSDSSTEITGSGEGYSWSTTKPKVPAGKYIWQRNRNELSNNTTVYSAAVCDIVTSNVVFDVDKNTKAITSKVWEDDISTSINEYDGSKAEAIRKRVTQTETDISGINTTISDIQTDVAGKADGSTVTTLTTKVNTISDTVDGHTQTIQSNTSRIDDAEDEIESTKTIASQTADKFTWLVKDGTSASNFTLTSRVAELISPQVVIKDPAGSATIITGGKIQANAITTAMLAANAIKSTNYSSGTSGSDVPANNYSTSGTFLDLTTGNIYTPNFAVNSVNGEAYLNGTIFASAGQIGNPGDAYWSIGTVYDSTWGDYAGLIANGNALIQSGKLTLSSDRLNSQNAGNYIQSGGYWYDFGLQVPDFTAGTDSHNQNFLYVRRIGHQPTDSTLDTDWSYLFRVDKAGNIYWNGHDISTGTFLPLGGGEVTGATTFDSTLTVKGKLTASSNVETNLMLQTNLGSTSSAQLTGAANAVVKPGVTGTLGVGNGGTGKTTALDAANAFITALPTWTAIPTDDTYFIRRDTGGGAIYGQVKFSTLWTYINNKITSTYDIANTYRRLDDNQFDTIDITDAQVGNLIVTGAGRFTNGLYGDLTGNVVGDVSGSSTKVLDSGDSTPTTFAYSKSGLSTASWFAAWNGYELRAINPTNVRTTIDALYAPRYNSNNAATADTFTDRGLYNLAFGHTSDATYPISNNGDLYVSNPGTMYQLYMGDTTMSFYKRVRNNSTLEWGAWSNIWDIGATKDGNGNIISSTYLKLSGGTMTGVITFNKVANAIRYTGSQATYNMIKFVDNTSDANGNGISIGGGGLVVIGGGESSDAIVGNYSGGGIEELALGSDGGIRFFTNVQNGVASAFQAFWNTNGILYPQTTNTGGLGSSSNKWANVYATTLHGNLDARTFTIGKTGKSVDWSGNVSWTIAEIADNATTSSAGWMSAADKSKLDSITVTSGGTIEANNIVGANGISVTLDKTTGVATVKHANSAITAGTASGTATSTLTNGGSFNIPTVTYDAYGHITAKGTTTLTLPNITSVSGNAGTATKFQSNQSVTLTGDTTGTTSSQAGWSIETTTKKLTNSGRLTSANVDNSSATYSNKITYFLASSSMTEGKPPSEGGILNFAWSDNKWGAQLAIRIDTTPHLHLRGNNNTSWDSSWLTVLDSNNYNAYAPKKDGTGATGTWGISISGNATTATSASSATNATNATYLTHKTLNSTTINNTAGTFAFSGSGDPWVGCDWVGLQVGDSVDKFQITRNDTGTLKGMIYRYNDSGGTNTSWTEWRRLLDEQNYSNYVVPKSGGEFTGAVTGTSFAASSFISANKNAAPDAGGVNLYSTSTSMEYAIMFRTTNNQVKHGYVQGDWATYLTMGGNASNIGTRGWIFKDHVNSKGVASISGAGNMALNGELAIGTTGTSISGSCSLVMDRNLSCLNFVFN